MENRTELIKKFKDRIIARYPELYVDFEYDVELDEYDIWHNSPELEFNSEKFIKFVGEAAQEILFNNNIYNFSFGYDYFRAKELKTREYTIKNTRIDKLEIDIINVEDTANYSSDTAKKTDISISRGSIDISFDSTESTPSGSYLLNTRQPKYNNTFSVYGIKEVA